MFLKSFKENFLCFGINFRIQVLFFISWMFLNQRLFRLTSSLRWVSSWAGSLKRVVKLIFDNWSQDLGCFCIINILVFIFLVLTILIVVTIFIIFLVFFLTIGGIKSICLNIIISLFQIFRLISPYQFARGLACIVLLGVFRFLTALLLFFLRFFISFILFLLSLRWSLCGIIMTSSFLWLFIIAVNRLLDYFGGNRTKIVVAEISAQHFTFCFLNFRTGFLT